MDKQSQTREVWDEITYSFPIFNVEMREGINKSIPYSLMDVIAYPHWD